MIPDLFVVNGGDDIGAGSGYVFDFGAEGGEETRP
jgi:hypothetical protein